jgi:hypothetical protein
MNNSKLGDAERNAVDMTDNAREMVENASSSFAKAFDQNRILVQKMMRAMQEESVRFVNTRMERTGRVMERTRECQGVSDLASLQHDWLLDFARDYAQMTKRFGEAMQDLSEQEKADRRLDVAGNGKATNGNGASASYAGAPPSSSGGAPSASRQSGRATP